MVFAAATLVPAPASARSSDEYTYTYEQLWRASVRLIAVDLRFPITERDPEIGYLLFDYRDQGREHHGSLELVRTTDSNGAAQVRVVVQVPTMPTYVERMLLDRLGRKLGSDYGQPPAAQRPVAQRPGAPTPPADDGDEAEEAD